jgi:NDP-sugar pyrophosphorylase family protein
MRDLIISHIESETWIWKDGVSYVFSEEDRPLGPDGAVLAAVKHWQLEGQAMMIPGDIMLPWNEVAHMNLIHSRRPSAVTSAVTSQEKRRSGELGRFIIEASTGRLRHVYGRGEPVPPVAPDELALTSAGALALSIDHFVEVCEAYARAHPDQDRPFGMRDHVFPWAIKQGGFSLYGHDLRGEILDLGTPDDISFGQLNWRQYISPQVAELKS